MIGDRSSYFSVIGSSPAFKRLAKREEWNRVLHLQVGVASRMAAGHLSSKSSGNAAQSYLQRSGMLPSADTTFSAPPMVFELQADGARRIADHRDIDSGRARGPGVVKGDTILVAKIVAEQ